MFLLQGLWQAGTGRAYSLLKTFIGLTVYLRSTSTTYFRPSWSLHLAEDLHGAYSLQCFFMGLKAYCRHSWGLQPTTHLHEADLFTFCDL